MRLVEDGTLDVTDNIAIFADNLAQSHFADFRQLSFAKSRFGSVVFIPKAIAFPQIPELDANDASESWSNQTTMQRSLSQTAYKIVMIIR